MGMNAEVIAIGPFHRSIIPFLQYPADQYANTREGVTIAEKVFFIESGTSESRKLAACFGVDPWDFNHHELDPRSADLDHLRDLFGEEAVRSFVGLRDAGFRFFFLPNG
jgi:hypothetical protein